MKTATVKWFRDCSDVDKKQINKVIMKNELARRKEYYTVITDESILPWYFKTDYIKNFSLSDSNLENFCPECGETCRTAEFIKETGYNERTVTVKCKCGCVYQYIG